VEGIESHYFLENARRGQRAELYSNNVRRGKYPEWGKVPEWVRRAEPYSNNVRWGKCPRWGTAY
jgi:hypothetical protein